MIAFDFEGRGFLVIVPPMALGRSHGRNNLEEHKLGDRAMTCESLRSSSDSARSSLRSSIATWALRVLSETSTRSADMSSACSASLASLVVSSFVSLSTCRQGSGILQESALRRAWFGVLLMLCTHSLQSPEASLSTSALGASYSR